MIDRQSRLKGLPVRFPLLLQGLVICLVPKESLSLFLFRLVLVLYSSGRGTRISRVVHLVLVVGFFLGLVQL